MSTGRESAWTWEPNWVLHGDSMAGILFRFAYANVLRPKAIKELVSATSIIQPIGTALYRFSTVGIDWRRFCSAICLSESELRAALLGDLLEALRWSPVVSQRLRYCPECLQFGYHARYFQIMALAACPIHRVPLLDSCPSCGAATPFYGVCNQLLERIYCCAHCNAFFVGKPVSIRTFFEPTVASEKLQVIWQPLDDWINEIDKLNLGFAALRDWVTDYAGEYRSEREVDAIHVVATVLPLPGGNFSWNAPSLRRKSIFYHEGGGHRVQAGHFDGNYIEEAYVEVRRVISKKLSEGRVIDILERCRKDSWAAVANNSEAVFNTRELAYILWRMKFENLSEPALVGMAPNRSGVFIENDTLPFPYWNLGKPAWKLLFWATYRGYVYDVERTHKNNGFLGDLLRGEPTRHCCILPSTDIRGRGRGIIAYPMPTVW